MSRLREKEYTAVKVDVVLSRTRKAVLIATDENEYWIPYSLIHEEDLAVLNDDFMGDMQIESWFVSKEGIE